MKAPIAYIVMFLVLCVGAVQVSASGGSQSRLISIDPCSLSASSYVCGGNITATCRVSTTFPSVTINRVTLTINDVLFTAVAPTSGNVTNGTWIFTTTNDARFSDSSLAITSVAASQSDGFICQATSNSGPQSDPGGSGGCHVLFVSPYAATNTCSCSQTRTTGTKTIWNTQPVTISYSSGCFDQTPYTFDQPVDYCDPGWVPQYSSCQSEIVNNVSRLFMTKTYEANDKTCCSKTQTAAGRIYFNHNTGSDCDPPIDNGVDVTCNPTYISQSGLTMGNTMINYLTTGGFNVGDYKVSTVPLSADMDQFAPLVFDLNQDGQQEIATTTSNGYLNIYRYDPSTASIDFVINSGGSQSMYPAATGASAITGITAYSDGTTVVDNSAPHYILVPTRKISGGSVVYKFKMLSDSLTEMAAISLNGTSGAGGVLCVSNYCFFAELGNGTSYSYDVVNNTLWVYPSMDVTFDGFSTFLPDQYANVLNNKPVYVPGVNGQAPYVVYLSTTNLGLCNPSCIAVKQGRLMVTVDGGLIGYYLLGVAPEDELFSSFSAQTEYILRDPVVIDRKIYVPFQETYNVSGGGQKQYMGVYVVSLLNATDYLANPVRTVVRKLYWKGTPSSVDEGISNAVSDLSNGFVKISALHSSDPLSASVGFDAPINTISHAISAGNGTSSVPPITAAMIGADNQHIWTRMGQDGGFGSGTTYWPSAWDLATGLRTTTGSSYTWHHSSSSDSGHDPLPYFELDYSTNKLWNTGVDYSCGFGCTYSYFTLCANVASYTDAVTSCTGVPSLGTSGGSAPVVSFKGLFNDYVMLGFGTSNLFLAYDLNNPTAGPIGFSISFGYYGLPQIYDSQDDTMIFVSTSGGMQYIMNFTKGLAASAAKTFTGGGGNTDFSKLLNSSEMTAAGIYVGTTTGVTRAWNYDWNNPRYIDSTGHKVKVLSWNPLTKSVTTTTCGAYFTPLYYNSDRHILGIWTQEIQPFLGTIVPKGPEWAYCDFSDESSPQITKLGIYLDPSGYSYTGNGVITTIIWAVPLLNYRFDQDNVHDGRATTWRIATVGQGWRDTFINGAATNPKVYASAATCTGTSSANPTCAAIWSFGANREIASTSASSFTQVIRFNEAGSLVDGIIGNFTRQGSIGVADANGDGKLDIVSSYGYYDFVSYQATSTILGSYQKGENAVPLDYNGDGALDFVLTSPTAATRLILSTPVANALLLGPDLAVLNLMCAQKPNSNAVQYRFAIRSPEVGGVSVSIDPGDGRGSIPQTPLSTIGVYIVPFTKSGSYTSTVKITSNTGYDSASATCTVNVNATGAVLSAEDCSVGVDGEFEYTDKIENHGWSIIDNGGVTGSLHPVNGKVAIASGWIVDHTLTNCCYATETVTASVIPGANALLEVISTSGSTASMKFVRSSKGASTIYDENGVVIGKYNDSSNVPLIVSMAFSVADNTIAYYLNGDQIFSKIKDFSVSSVRISQGGVWDYVRASGSGSKMCAAEPVNLVPMNGDLTLLNGCSISDMENAPSIDVRRSSPHVDAYCASTTDGDAGDGRCDYATLGKVVRRNSECTKEAYNYCVYKTIGFGTPGGATVGTGIAGGTTCMALLGGSVFMSNVAIPTISGIWSTLFAPNLIAILIFIGAVVVIGIVLSATRRGS